MDSGQVARMQLVGNGTVSEAEEYCAEPTKTIPQWLKPDSNLQSLRSG
jgi:hypothetical protein